MRRVFLAAFVILLAMDLQALAREPRHDPQTGKIRILYLGDPFVYTNPYPIMRMEPSFRVTPVTSNTYHATLDFIRKQMRNYMPRTYDRLRNNYDIIILSDANKGVFIPQELNWMSDSVAEGGLGIMMTGGAESFEGRAGINPTWSTTTVADVLPIIMLDGKYVDQSMTLVIADQEEELARTLPWNTLGPKGVFGEGHAVALKQTSHLVAEAIAFGFGRVPHLVWWDVDKGRGFAFMTGWRAPAGAAFVTWRYYPDFAINSVMFTAGRKLPEDVDLMYLLRRRMREYGDVRGTLNSMIEIVDSFGGNFAVVERGAIESDEKKAEADGVYLEGEYEMANEAYASAISFLNEKVQEARIVAKQALFYVYLVEWAAVTSVLMISGVTIYTLMVRRKMYTPVTTTRLAERND